ncbi:hypothetical protein R1flu_005336 [Riccia fluitans]|uniref:Transposase n=1 Tax=Riccia fluitans TaxID=41844 RepID=A0ABD1YSX3_9MARC
MLLHFMLLYFCYSYCVCTEPSVVYVDCRFNSSRSGYHGTLPIINVEDDRVIEMVTLTHKQTGSKLQLVQLVSVHLKLPEAGANTEIQRQRPLKYPELAAHDLAYKLKSWIYTCTKNVAVRILPGVRKCVTEIWSAGQMCKYPEGGETHKAVVDFLKKCITENKMKCYVRARENFISETFHSVINKFATKRIHFDASHTPSLACAAMDWYENIRREVQAVYHRASNDTAVRCRAKTNKALVDRTSVWKMALANRVFI